MVMNEKEVREECVKLAELSGTLLRQYNELEEILAGAQIKEKESNKEIELLKDYIDNISAIIAYQCSLKEQDLWMADMIRRGLYKPDEELLEILKEDGRYRYTEEDEE